MGLITWNSIAAQFRPSPTTNGAEITTRVPQDATEKNDIEVEVLKTAPRTVVESGVARVEAVQAVWGKHGKYIIVAG